MDKEIHLHFHFSEGGVFTVSDRNVLNQIFAQGVKVMSKLDDLEAAVKRTTEVVASAKVLIDGIAQRIIDAGVDPAKLQALTDELTSDSDTLAAAVAANTPAA